MLLNTLEFKQFFMIIVNKIILSQKTLIKNKQNLFKSYFLFTFKLLMKNKQIWLLLDF